MIFLVRETFPQAGFDEPTRRHFLVPSETPKDAVKAIRDMRYHLNGVIYGSVPGSDIEVIARRRNESSQMVAV